MKKLPITLLGAAAVANNVMAEDHISVHYLNYQEYDDKVKAGDSIVSIEKSIGLDWTINLEVGYDTVSGASPSWGPTTPIASVADANNRALKTQQAQGMTDQVIRAGYDPNSSNYKVQKYELEDTRQSINGSATYRDELRNEWTFGANYSTEEDYRSLGVNAKGLYMLTPKRTAHTVWVCQLCSMRPWHLVSMKLRETRKLGKIYLLPT